MSAVGGVGVVDVVATAGGGGGDVVTVVVVVVDGQSADSSRARATISQGDQRTPIISQRPSKHRHPRARIQRRDRHQTTQTSVDPVGP